jgi:PTH1 family peptidyl-tRNA hydrolase
LAPRDSSSDRFLIVGLGNPGKQYAKSRHNVGQDAVELLAERTGSKLKVGRDRALITETRLAGASVVLAVPTTYMNDSGNAVGPMVRRYKITDLSRVIIAHDELDLDPGVVRLKFGGGLAGHNGLKSISQHLHTNDYTRVRIGVGKPRTKEQGADHVLNAVTGAERKILDVAVQVAADAIEAIIELGLDAAMQKFHAI